MGQPLGQISRQMVDALAEGDKTLEELAVAVYGELDVWTRKNAQQTIARLRFDNNYEIERRSVYRLVRRGKK